MLGKVFIYIMSQFFFILRYIFVFAFNNYICLYQDCLCQILPQSCEIVTLGTCGILIENAEMETILEERVCAFLPEIPNVTIKVITIVSKDDFAQYYEQMRLALAKHGTNRSKCLLLFCNQAGRALAREAAGVLQLW